jgi:protein arginine kinase activator
MLCCICRGQEATVHLTQTMIATNQIRKLDLCEQCAESKGVNDPTGFSLAELLPAAEFSEQVQRSQD